MSCDFEMDDEFSRTMRAVEGNRAGEEEYDKIYFDPESLIARLRKRSHELGCAKFREGHPDYMCSKGYSKPDAAPEEISDLMVECKRAHEDIEARIAVMSMALSDLEDIQKGLANAFRTEYDSDMLPRAHGYWAKFVKNGDHWSLRGVKQEWKADYDKCVDWFKSMAGGLDTHNFAIGLYQDMHKAYLSFTVSGCPGSFEIGLPLSLSESLTADPPMHSCLKPMQIGIVWRRRIWIPVFDYFFDDFGTYKAQEAVDRIRKFVEDREWEKFCNTRSYAEKSGFYVDYDEDTRKRLESELAADIEASGREGKKDAL